MCKCVAYKCSPSQGKCGCVKKGIYCNPRICSCDVKTCQNQAPPHTSSPPPPPKGRSMGDETCFHDELVIVSWNVCHFSSFIQRHHVSPSEERGLHLVRELVTRVKDVDVYVFQEFPKQELVPSFYDIFTEHGYAYESLGEHLFLWNIKTILPSRHHVTDMYARATYIQYKKKEMGEVATMFIRGLSTLHFTWRGKEYSITSVHFHSEETKARESLDYLLRTYSSVHAARFGKEQTTQTKHIIVGDFNLNLHTKDESHMMQDWIVSGNKHMKTTGGGKGFDWLITPSSSGGGRDKDTYIVQRVLRMTRPKNARRGIAGVSDHHPIVFYVSQ